MIFLCYPGVGKSFVVRDKFFKKLYGLIDLESSMFKFDDGTKPENWAEQWCKVAIYLSIQGYNILGPTHQEIRDYLKKINYKDVICIMPDLLLEYKWCNKLWDRFMNSREEKDYNSYTRAKTCYKEDIRGIKEDSISSYPLYTLDYSLRGIINSIMEENDRNKTDKTNN